MDMEEEKRDDSPTLEELMEQNRRLQEENERLKALSPKERLYDHVNVSLKTMDRIIAALFVLLGVVLIMGILNR